MIGRCIDTRPGSSSKRGMSDASTPVCWVVTDGRRGIENQALGLAEAVQRQMRASGGDLAIGKAVAHKDGTIALPDTGQPALWIGCGRLAVPLARPHSKVFPNCFFVYVQDPRRRWKDFDLILAPTHDRMKKSNGVSMIGSPNRIDRARLEEDAAGFTDRLNALPGPRAAVLIGGPSKRFRMDAKTGAYLEERLEQLAGLDLSLMITVSRRTPDAVRERLKARFSGRDRVWFHDGEGENPYFAFLAAADWVFVTEESTNMLVEAASAGKPVYALPLSGSPGKFARLHAELEAHGAMRPWLGRLERWSYPRLAETERAAAELIARWKPEFPGAGPSA